MKRYQILHKFLKAKVGPNCSRIILYNVFCSESHSSDPKSSSFGILGYRENEPYISNFWNYIVWLSLECKDYCKWTNKLHVELPPPIRYYGTYHLEEQDRNNLKKIQFMPIYCGHCYGMYIDFPDAGDKYDGCSYAWKVNPHSFHI